MLKPIMKFKVGDIVIVLATGDIIEVLAVFTYDGVGIMLSGDSFRDTFFSENELEHLETYFYKDLLKL